jgi:SAM-dependent methyltransferase
MKKQDIKKIVKKGYSKIAKGECSTSCCGGTSADSSVNISKKIGYSDQELAIAPQGANLGLGCGNPVALASLKEGETVLDLGSGAGFDCFIAANKVGASGKVIGVDMTPSMIEKARLIAKKNNYKNVEFRLGEIENLPVADNSIDVIISNCVINLSPDKEKTFKEAYRVLKPGGRFIISDLVILNELPDEIRNSVEGYIGCISGAMLKSNYIRAIKNANFINVEIISETPFPLDCMLNDATAIALIKSINLPFEKIQEIIMNSIVSIKVRGEKAR